MRGQERPTELGAWCDFSRHDGRLCQQDVVRHERDGVFFGRKMLLEIDAEPVNGTEHDEQDEVVLHQPFQEAVGQDESRGVHVVVEAVVDAVVLYSSIRSDIVVESVVRRTIVAMMNASARSSFFRASSRTVSTDVPLISALTYWTLLFLRCAYVPKSRSGR